MYALGPSPMSIYDNQKVIIHQQAALLCAVRLWSAGPAADRRLLFAPVNLSLSIY